jgi:hypothetical protein
VDACLELVHGDLAENGGDGAVDLLRQQHEARARRIREFEQAVEHDRLAEHGRGLGNG